MKFSHDANFRSRFGIAKVERSTSPNCGDKHRGPPFRTGPGPTYRSKWVDDDTISNGCLKVKVFIADATNLAMNVSANFLTLLACLGVQKSVNHLPTRHTVEICIEMSVSGSTPAARTQTRGIDPVTPNARWRVNCNS